MIGDGTRERYSDLVIGGPHRRFNIVTIRACVFVAEALGDDLMGLSHLHFVTTVLVIIMRRDGMGVLARIWWHDVEEVGCCILEEGFGDRVQ